MFCPYPFSSSGSLFLWHKYYIHPLFFPILKNWRSKKKKFGSVKQVSNFLLDNNKLYLISTYLWLVDWIAPVPRAFALRQPKKYWNKNIRALTSTIRSQLTEFTKGKNIYRYVKQLEIFRTQLAGRKGTEKFRKFERITIKMFLISLDCSVSYLLLRLQRRFYKNVYNWLRGNTPAKAFSNILPKFAVCIS